MDLEFSAFSTVFYCSGYLDFSSSRHTEGSDNKEWGLLTNVCLLD